MITDLPWISRSAVLLLALWSFTAIHLTIVTVVVLGCCFRECQNWSTREYNVINAEGSNWNIMFGVPGKDNSSVWRGTGELHHLAFTGISWLRSDRQYNDCFTFYRIIVTFVIVLFLRLPLITRKKRTKKENSSVLHVKTSQFMHTIPVWLYTYNISCSGEPLRSQTYF